MTDEVPKIIGVCGVSYKLITLGVEVNSETDIKHMSCWYRRISSDK